MKIKHRIKSFYGNTFLFVASLQAVQISVDELGQIRNEIEQKNFKVKARTDSKLRYLLCHELKGIPLSHVNDFKSN